MTNASKLKGWANQQFGAAAFGAILRQGTATLSQYTPAGEAHDALPATLAWGWPTDDVAGDTASLALAWTGTGGSAALLFEVDSAMDGVSMEGAIGLTEAVGGGALDTLGKLLVAIAAWLVANPQSWLDATNPAVITTADGNTILTLATSGAGLVETLTVTGGTSTTVTGADALSGSDAIGTREAQLLAADPLLTHRPLSAKYWAPSGAGWNFGIAVGWILPGPVYVPALMQTELGTGTVGVLLPTVPNSPAPLANVPLSCWTCNSTGQPQIEDNGVPMALFVEMASE
jgi:hypothetical protein